MGMVLISLASAEVITIEPSELDSIQMYAGETITQNIIIKTDGNYLVYLDYNITGNTYNMDGFEINLPQEIFVEEEETIQIEISTLLNFRPDSFIIHFFASTEKAEETITETFTENETITFGDLELEINGTGNVTIRKFKENPKSGFGIPSLNKFFEIKSSIQENNSIIKVNYTDAEVNALGVNENTLRLYFYNETNNKWELIDSWVDTINNIIFAKTDHFSLWGVFGNVVSINPSSSSGSSCRIKEDFNWNCSEWSDCINGNQTRVCKKYNNCGNTYGKPNESRSCIEQDLINNTIKQEPEYEQEKESGKWYIIFIILGVILLMFIIIYVLIKEMEK